MRVSRVRGRGALSHLGLQGAAFVTRPRHRASRGEDGIGQRCAVQSPASRVTEASRREIATVRLDRTTLELLRCPADKAPIRPVTADELRRLNDAIAQGRAAHADGTPVTERLDSALATADGGSFYAVEDGVPILLPALRIAVHAGGATRVAQDPPATPLPELMWEKLATHWMHRRPPARPAPEDTALFERLVAGVLEGRSAPRALVLGVTPEIVTMRWPAGTQLFAVDASTGMIRAFWPARDAPDATVIRGNWVTMPIVDAAFDVVVGDGSIGVQPYPDNFFRVVREVRRALRADGALVTRVFTRPETKETLAAIFADLHAGRIGTLDAYWWRGFAALHGDRANGGRSHELWEAWAANVPDPPALIRSLGWPKEDLWAMDSLRLSPHSMIFPTLRELQDDLAYDFEVTACEFPTCELGDRDPTLVLRPRERDGDGATRR